MSVKNIVGRGGRLGYRIRINIGKDADGRYISKCRTVYGTVRQAQEVEAQMLATAERAHRLTTEADIHKKCYEAIANIKPIPLAVGYEKSLDKPHCRTTGKGRVEFKRNYYLDFVEWMRENRPQVRYMQNVKHTNAEDYIGFIRENGPFLRFREGQKPVRLSNDTLNEYHRTIQQVFELMKHESGMWSNPFSLVRKLRANHAERDSYTSDQLKTIFLKADDYLQPMFFVGLFTGLSEGDVCTLKKSEIHFDRHHIYRKRNKTAKTSRRVSAIPMLPVLEDFLRKLVEAPSNPTEYVFPKQAEDYFHARSLVSKKIKTFLEIDCEFETTARPDGRTRKQSILDFHSLRHTFCSMAGVVGIPLNVVQAIVGHMTPRMTELYSRHVEEQERLRWIRLLGERINELPGIFGEAFVELPKPGMEPDRVRLIEMIKNLDMDTTRKVIDFILKQNQPRIELSAI